MMKKIAVVNDLSGFGRCSLTAAISVLSAMGVQACPLPTAVLSAQTGFEGYHYVSLTQEMESLRKSWEEMGVQFDGVYTGFAADEEQIRHMIRIADTFHRRKRFFWSIRSWETMDISLICFRQSSAEACASL